MNFDLARARLETPGCEKSLFFDSAGASLMPQVVLDAQIAHLEREAERGGYTAAAEAEEAVERTYRALARLLNCSPREIAFMENATIAWNMAFFAFDFQPGDRILTAEAEYASNYINYLKVAAEKGVEIAVVPSDDSGTLCLTSLQEMIDARVKLIAVTHVPTNGGLVNPAAEIGAIARQAGIPFLLDACQSAGQIDLDVAALGCDLLSGTGRKYLRGPRGSGFLYVRDSILDKITPPWFDLHAAEWTAPGSYVLRPDARRFENWEFNYAAVIGLGVAVDYALAWGLPEIEPRVAGLAASLRRALADLPGLQVHDLGRKRCGITTFSVEGLESQALQQALLQRNIITSTSGPASTRIDATRRHLPEMLRASVHYFNSEDDVAKFVAAVKSLLP